MGRNGDPPIRTEHVIDATLIGVLAFTAVILADVLPLLLSGQAAYLTPSQILARVPTAFVAFFLAFAFQWLRARGIDALNLLP